MTCVVFAKAGGILYTAADGRVTSGDHIMTDVDIKVYQAGPGVVGEAGSSKTLMAVHKTIGQYVAAYNRLTSRDLAYLVAECVPKEVAKEDEAEWIIGTADIGQPLYSVDSNCSVAEIGEQVYAIGSGYSYALGYLEGRVLNGQTVADAVRCAAKYDCSVGPVHWYCEYPRR